MSNSESNQVIHQIITEAGNLIPFYMQNEEDKRIANGSVAICIIDQQGMVYGKMYGDNIIRARESFRVAWTKASQVHITGMKTGEFERLAFNNEINEKKFGIQRPDYIGWVGGQPLVLKDGSRLSAGFSGFRGIIDLEIVSKALDVVNSKL
jgi:uncharacterized protein GlcG (DUF336 family)